MSGRGSCRGRGRGRSRVTITDDTSSAAVSSSTGLGLTNTINATSEAGTSIGPNIPTVVDVRTSGCDRGSCRGRGRGSGRGRSRVIITNDTSSAAASSSTGLGLTNTINATSKTGTSIGPNIPTVDEQCVQALSTNLPKMDFLEVAAYFQLLRSPELRQAKDSL